MSQSRPSASTDRIVASADVGVVVAYVEQRNPWIGTALEKIC